MEIASASQANTGATNLIDKHFSSKNLGISEDELLFYQGHAIASGRGCTFTFLYKGGTIAANDSGCAIIRNEDHDITSYERQNMAEPTYEELKERLAQLEKETQSKKRSGDMIFKVGEKGGVSVYGLGRFPVTLYYEQWNRLLGAAEEIKKFMEENKSRLKLKESA
jgi:hypothetical protein